jgi:hypothetical protein
LCKITKWILTVADAFCITSCAMQANASIDRVSLGKGSQTKHRSSMLSVVREGGYSNRRAVKRG